MPCARGHTISRWQTLMTREERVLKAGRDLLATWLGQLASAAGPRTPACPQCGVHTLERGAPTAEAAHGQQPLRYGAHCARAPELPRVWAQLATAPSGPGVGGKTAHQWRSAALGSRVGWVDHVRRGGAVARNVSWGGGGHRDAAHAC